MTSKTRFKEISQSTAADWQIIVTEQKQYIGGLAERVLTHLRLLAGDYGGFPVDRLQHCLQTAKRAADDGRDDEYVVCALLHDIGDTLGSLNHADVSAAILQPFVSDANHWMIKHHAVFQGYNFFHHLGLDRNLRDNFRSSPHFDHTAEFVALYDDPAFDASLPALSLDEFAPLVRKVFATPKQGLYQKLVS